MSLGYNCWFASPSPDPQQLLDQVTNDYIDEIEIADDKWFFFFESQGVFYFYYNERDDFYNKEDTLLLTIYPASASHLKKHTLPVGELEVRHCWYLVMGKSNADKANEAYARLVRTILQNYAGDFATLFEGSYLHLCRLAGRVYINEGSGLAQEPLLSLLEVSAYEVGNYSNG